ncbi:hypothetical protein FA10DRAFT_291736 [Acaromyces ingoldii]|uniref:Uncharacterized protein n=1 Tax=Acaromyces ingoldii TaxID=215250 RepID=A0A316YG05_9BASI|nr:hypothetical protein FA10DRAFT_291736 [Acaromyces ingoldii]PWN86675.1 hypothetical protein FA10DRAFT_291736 [Acaromyces ingoldii]
MIELKRFAIKQCSHEEEDYENESAGLTKNLDLFDEVDSWNDEEMADLDNDYGKTTGSCRVSKPTHWLIDVAFHDEQAVKRSRQLTTESIHTEKSGIDGKQETRTAWLAQCSREQQTFWCVDAFTMQLYVLKAYWRKLVVLNIAQGRILLRSFQPGTYRIRFLIQLFDPSAHEEVTREKNPWKFPKRNNTVQYPASAVGLTLSFGNPKSGAKEESVDMDISDDAQQLLAGRSLYSELFDGTEAAMSFSLPEHSLASSGPAIRVQREKHWTKYREAGWIALQSHQFEIPGGCVDKLVNVF